jgi:hypothetical protein
MSVPFAVRTGIQRAQPISTNPARATGMGTSPRWVKAAAATVAAAPVANSAQPHGPGRVVIGDIDVG